ncbi:MAG: hypothetical protein J5903_01745, partial [Clostridia bacterium]|nr:hypothetical protein [Clostridia bacterium]
SPGYSITFVRDPERTENYKLAFGGGKDNEGNQIINKEEIGDIYFTPPGTKEFTNVIGDITVGDRTSQCYISRKDGKMFVTFFLQDDEGNLGNYYIYIDAVYKGEGNSTYIVTGVERSQTIYSTQYLTNYYLYYYYFGAGAAQSYQNNFGTIDIVEVFDEDCNVIESYAEGKFGSASAFYDYDGNPLGFKHDFEVEDVQGQNRVEAYTVTYVADDGFTYNVYFITGPHPYMAARAYIVNLFGREETLTTEDGVYEVTIERVAASDRGYKLGALSKIKIVKNGEEVENGAIAIIGGEVYLIVRNDSGNATYYKVEIDLETASQVDEKEKVLKIESVGVDEKESETYYSDDEKEKSFVDFVDGKITVISLVGEKENRTNYIVFECEYDEESETYTVKTSISSYTVRIVDGKAVIEEIKEEEEKEPEPDAEPQE